MANHIGQIVAADFFVVPTVTLSLFVLVVLAHDRRRVVHVAITEHPTSAWTAQQLRNAFPHEKTPSSPRRSHHPRRHADPARSAPPRAPWQNAYVERFIGSIRRECLDQVIVLNAAGLQRVVTAYVAYYTRARTHLGLDKDSPTPRPVMPAPGRIVARGQRLAPSLRPRGCVVPTPALSRSPVLPE